MTQQPIEPPDPLSDLGVQIPSHPACNWLLRFRSTADAAVLCRFCITSLEGPDGAYMNLAFPGAAGELRERDCGGDVREVERDEEATNHPP
jgi:hypothetical protein